MAKLTARGYKATWLLPLGGYFVVVNASLEELFWRGVILNEFDQLGDKLKRFGAVWTTCTFAAWHYLVLRLLLRPVWAEVTLLGLVAMGAAMSVLYRRTGSIVLPILWHALVFDLTLIIVLIVITRAL